MYHPVVTDRLTSEFAPLAWKRGVLDLGEDGVVHPRLARDTVAQPVQGIVAWDNLSSTLSWSRRVLEIGSQAEFSRNLPLSQSQ